MDSVTQSVLASFQETFNEDTVFGTDNFEDSAAIRHPCYSHYGVIKAFEEFLIEAVERAYQAGRVESNG